MYTLLSEEKYFFGVYALGSIYGERVAGAGKKLFTLEGRYIGMSRKHQESKCDTYIQGWGEG